MGSAGPLGAGMGMGGARRGRGGFGRFGNQDSRHSSMSRRSRSVMDLGSGHVSRDVSSDESDNEVRFSIDQINLDSDEDEPAQVEDKKGKMAMKNADRHSGEKGLRPIRVERHEHEERVVSVNMESSSSKSAELRQQAQATEDDALFVQDDDQATTQEPKEGEARVKQEPTDDDQVMEDVAAHDDTIITDDGLLPVQKVKVRRNLGSRETSTALESPPAKDPKSLLRTKEDIEEFDRHAHDLDIMKDLLSREEKEEKNTATEKDPDTEQSEKPAEGEPDTAADDKEKDAEDKDKDEDESAKDKLAGQLFLMQFPPMTPNLVVPGEGGDNAEGAADNAANPGAEGTTTNGGGRPQEPAVKHEDGVEVLDGADETTAREPSKIVTASDWQLPAGRVGKLNVHASGRVSMNWGGISFELDRATAVDFLQEALIVSTPPDAEEVDAEDDKRVWAMGQLSGKFTVMPDWSKML